MRIALYKGGMVSLTIVADKEYISTECLENYADWLLQNGWLGFADKILINNKVFFDNEKDGEKYLKFIKTLHSHAVKQEGDNHETICLSF